MSARAPLLLLLLLGAFGAAPAQDAAHHDHHGMAMDATGAVMNENTDRFPRDCTSDPVDVAFTIHAGRDYASGQPGRVFGMSEHEIRVPPCSRVSVTFVNDDSVRHQWMVHGLPRYLYPAGMFHIEVEGGHRRTGTFIVPGEDRTYLIHCDVAQHMEKGMRGQLVVGNGSGNLWGVPGISDDFRRADYLPGRTGTTLALLLAAGLAGGWWLTRQRPGRRSEK